LDIPKSKKRTMNYTHLLASDLDGTLLNSEEELSKKDHDTLRELGKKNVLRVIATGRSLYSAKKVLPEDFPIDYMVFSTGSGIVHWQSGEILHKNNLRPLEVKQAFDLFMQLKLDFCILHAVPENHRYQYIRNRKSNPDLDRRNKLYGIHAQEMVPEKFQPYASCQLLAIGEGQSALACFEAVKGALPELKTVRSTSPLDGKSIWIEVYAKEVGKAHGISILANKYNIPVKNTFSIGNDYNDLDMLQWTAHSFVVSNAPEELKKEFSIVSSNKASGFSEAVRIWTRKAGFASEDQLSL
jgi:Cof subfamily protein (haloacid dehalogenase superfamily)